MRPISDALDRIWRRRGPAAVVLWPLSLAYRAGMALRRRAYQKGWLSVHRFDLPVVVVGNISVGGTGKTPAVVAIANYLKENGRRPGIVSRGYGGNATGEPRAVGPDSPPEAVGDEPVLIARRTACPVVVARDRPAAVRKLLEENDCDVVLADDGLQHLALHRDVEIAMVDGVSGFGNGLCLPAGPLREPVSRLGEVDFVIEVGGGESGYGCTVRGDTAVNLRDSGQSRPLAAFKNGPVHAVAGIGNPQRFFNLLRSAGLDVLAHPFPDHHAFHPGDLEFAGDLPVLMTEKDAVKCSRLAGENVWYVPVDATIDAEFLSALLDRV